MNAADPTREDQEIDQLLADTDGTILASNIAESTIDKLRSELATLELALQQPASPDLYQNESACARAVELVAAMGRDAESGSAKRSVTASQELGELGPYQLLDWLGQGGMGTVYKALHPRLDKLVAIKVLPAERLKSEDALGRFQREIKAVGKVDHPHLVRALDAGEANGTHYLVMEFVSGTDLGALLKQRGAMPVADACELIVQAAKGLQAAHSRGMVHRDIKPANLMLAIQEFGPPVVKVLDLGLALLADAHDVTGDGLTSDNQIMGTIDYMAPEQAENSHSVDVRADVYSLGATLYALLTGGSIFAGRPNQTLIQKLSTLANEPAAPIQSRCGAVSEPLANIVHRMLSRRPSDRFASMAEVIAALQPFAAGANLSALLASDAAKTNEISRIVLASGCDRRISSEPINPDASVFRLMMNVRTAIATAIVGVVVLAAILLSIRTPNGEVVVEVPDDLPAELRKEIQVNVTGDGATEVVSEANGWKVGIKEGKYRVELTGGQDRVQVEVKQVTVTRKKKSIVTVALKPLGTVAAKTNEKPADANRQFAEWLKSFAPPNPFFEVTLANGKIQRINAQDPLPTEPFRIRYVVLWCPQFDQQGDAFLDEFVTRVKGLHFSGLMMNSTTLTSAGVARVMQLPELSGLNAIDITSDNVDDAVFPVLARIPRLTYVNLNSPQIAGKGLGTLRQMKNLSMLKANGLTVEGLAELQHIPLEYLQLDGIKFTEPVVAVLTQFKLQALYTNNAGIDDAVLARIAEMTTLNLLSLYNDPITDAGLMALKRLKSLAKLELPGTKITAVGVADLQQALPNCKIQWDAPKE